MVTVAGAAQQGVRPGEFRWSLHDPVPLVVPAEPWWPAEYEKVVDPFKLFGAPADLQAGAHPDLSVAMVLRTGEFEEILEGLNTPAETAIELPPDLLTGLGEMPACSAEAFEEVLKEIESATSGGCPADTQVGVVGALFGGELLDRAYPLYKLETAPGDVATIGFPYEILFLRQAMKISVTLRTDGDFGVDLTRTNPADFNDLLPAPFMTLWGVPGAPAHDAERIDPDGWTWGASVPGPHPPLINSLTDCESGPSEARLRLRYVEEVGETSYPEAGEDAAYRAFSPALTGCEGLPFEPTVEVEPTDARAEAATGIKLALHLPQARSGGEAATPPLREASIALPAGMTLKAAALGDMVGCAPAADPCPAASRLGSVVVESPLAEAPLDGSVYLAKAFDNPFHSRWALYLAVDGPGFDVRLPAQVEVEPDGRLRVTISSLPRVPVEAVAIELPGGPTAALLNPPTCGTSAAQVRLTPWLAPRAATEAEAAVRFEPAAGGGCPSSGARPFAPHLDATISGTPSSLGLQLRRPAGDQPLKRFSLTMPPGLVPSLADLSPCGENEIGIAACPPESRVGSVVVTSGGAAAPLRSRGDVYLAGPYRGAPRSLVAIVPATASGGGGEPAVDPGSLVARSTLRIDPRTAQLEIASDSLPESLAGAPLRIGSLEFEFGGRFHAPTGCDPARVAASVEGAEGARVDLDAGLGSTGCPPMEFSPGLRLRVEGATDAGGHPRLRAAITARPRDADIASAKITLPAALALDRTRLGRACRPAGGDWSSCPSGSIVGHAVAWSPIAETPLEGPVRLLRSPFALPRLGISLDGAVPLELTADMRRRRKALQLRFAELPDVPLTHLNISFGEGGMGIFVNRRALCARRGFVEGGFAAYNGKVVRRRSALLGDC